jgi:glycerol-3-phosphate dehydrogenase (NAD(P)+)
MYIEGCKVGVIGGGAWGTALASAAARAGNDVLLWALEASVVEAINISRENTVFLPGTKLPEGISATSDYDDLAPCEFILMVCPAQFMRPVASKLMAHIPPKVPLVICAKGIEKKSGALMSEVLAEAAPGHPVAVLSGPTFASEVVKGMTSALTLACADDKILENIAGRLGTHDFRIYGTDDVIGAQIGGAVKNVLAIACGITAGRGMGENARAALITRGMAEMIRFARARGGRAETLMGLSGLGDLILTCSSTQSRNFSLGEALGQGKTMDEILSSRNSVSEGVHSSVILATLAENLELDMPIAAAVHNILHQGAGVGSEIDAFLSRPYAKEFQ